MIVRYGKHTSEQFTTVTSVMTVAPMFEDDKFIGYKLVCQKDENSPISPLNPPVFGKVLLGKDFDVDCFEVSSDEDVPCTWILKEKISRLGVNAEDHDSFDSFLTAIQQAVGNEASEDSFTPIFS